MKKLFIAIAMLTAFGASAQTNWHNNPVGAVFAREGGETPEGTYRLFSDGIEVYTIISSDQTEFYQPASLFYGDNDADKSRVDALAPDGRVASSMNCFLVRSDGKQYLVDTGLPVARGGKTLDRLQSLGVSPEDIDAVFVTHSHFDHIGGLLGGDDRASYPKAKVYIPVREWTYMQTSMPDEVEKLKAAYADRLVTFNPGEILPSNVVAIDAPGHTPGHGVYNVCNLLFVGDIMHGMSLQLVDPEICANFDMDKPLAVKSREAVLHYAASNSLTVLGAHIPCNGVLF